MEVLETCNFPLYYKWASAQSSQAGGFVIGLLKNNAQRWKICSGFSFLDCFFFM